MNRSRLNKQLLSPEVLPQCYGTMLAMNSGRKCHLKRVTDNEQNVTISECAH